MDQSDSTDSIKRQIIDEKNKNIELKLAKEVSLKKALGLSGELKELKLERNILIDAMMKRQEDGTTNL